MSAKADNSKAGFLQITRALNIKFSQIALLTSLVCLYAFCELGGISMLIPILEFVEKGPAAYQDSNLGALWKVLLQVSQFAGIPLNLLTLLIMAFVPIIFRQVFSYMEKAYSYWLRNNAIATLRKEQLGLFLNADMDFVFTEGQGPLLSSVTEQSQRAGNVVISFLKVISSTTLVCLYGVFLFVLSPPLAAISIASFSLIFLVARPLIKRSRRYSGQISDQNRHLYSVIGEKLYAIRLIKMLNKEKDEIESTGKTIDRVASFMYRAETANAMIGSLSEPVALLSVFLILYIAVVYLNINLAGLGTFLFVLMRTFPKIKTINEGRQGIAASGASLGFVESKRRKAKSYRRIVTGKIPFFGPKNTIEFSGVGFSYNGKGAENRVLKEISLKIPRNSFIGIVGASGGGKSTLVDLLPRLRDATGGHIHIDGTDLKEFNLQNLRRSIGFVTQEPILFNDTIRNNLIYGYSGIPTNGQIEQAARAAFAHQFIVNFPQGYDTVIGDRGLRLSGGERQRLAMARVILQDPEIIILDEPTSALDSESEEFIQKTINSLRRTKTVIVVAHRLSTIKKADRIFLLERGKIVESGSLDELLQRNGAFCKLFALQLS